jgi:hypothetical protein
MGDVTPSGKYDLVKIEDPNKDGECNNKWVVTAKNILSDSHSSLTARKCEVGAFDGDWVDAQLYPTGDFSQEWFDKLTISSGDKQLRAHTQGADATVPFAIEVSGCSITVHLRDGCDNCKATGTLSEGGDAINWDSGFNDGDFWIRKDHGCCTLFEATMNVGSSDALSLPLQPSSTPEDSACAKKFTDGRWVDRSKGDFMFGWVPYMKLSEEPLDVANGRMIAPVEQGSWKLPVNFFADGDACKLKICLSGHCGDEGYSIGTLNDDEINWDVRLDHGKWARQTPNDVCLQADSEYSCCNLDDGFSCVATPNAEVCTNAGGQFCCDPADPYAQCGFEPTMTSTMV